MIYTTNKNIASITLNRPRIYNAFDDAIIIKLTKILKATDNNKDIHVLTIDANGPHFSAGADLNWMRKMADFNKRQNQADALLLANLLQTLSAFSKPVIALAQGKTFGGGVGLLACCDIVIASCDAQFCFSEAKLGLIPATIAPYVMRKLGYSQTLRYFLSAESINAQVAKQLGLVHHLSAPDQLATTAGEFIDKLHRNGPQALTSIKKLMQHLNPIDNKTIKYTAKLLAKVRSGEEAAQGLQAFLNKESAPWVK
ncbi:MAG: enoyl-CoA hydratase/isomerase family protein [Gammaproteobacteria bacterium]|nr:enoyl-CoA hydratase/isomerase family protein [Gammaproteobacteria bacterium]